MTGFDLTEQVNPVNLLLIKHKQSSCLQTIQTGGQLNGDTSLYKVSECSLYSVSGCDSVGRVVTYDTRGSKLESSHLQNFIMNIFTVNCLKDENEEKEAWKYTLKILGSV